MNEKVFYSTSDNRTLCGIINRVNVSKEIIVICHAKASSKDSRVTSSVANTLNNYNHNNFRFDFLGCGESDGDINDFNITNMISNLNDTLKWLMDEYGYSEFILFGCGEGAKVISFVDRKKYDIKKLLLWYGTFNYGLFKKVSYDEKIAKKQGFVLLEDGSKLPYEYYLDNAKYVAYKELFNWIDVPKLFVHGSNDIVVSYKQSVKLSKKCKHGTLYLIGEADHGFTNDRHLKKAIKETVRFID